MTLQLLFFITFILFFGRIHGQINLAPDGTASQSSTHQYGYNASLAISGPATHVFADGCSHTLLQSDVWWKEEFGTGYIFFTNVILYFREYYFDRMDGFSLYVTNSSNVSYPPDGHLCYRDNDIYYPNLLQDIDCYAVGQNVVLYNSRETWVEICYIEINGCHITKWGKDCISSCSKNCINQHCFPENGSCVFGCNSGFCNDNVCDNDGTCATGCISGRLGQDCDKLCPVGTYGIQCLHVCSPNCFSYPCNEVTGECYNGGCVKGWQGTNCTTECSNGTYGRNCSKTCDGCIGEQCDRFDGHCTLTNACKPGWKYSVKCDTRCDKWHYGDNCTGTCNCLAEPCNTSTGFCPEGCKKGWKGEVCDEACDNLHYGDNCTRKCDCTNKCNTITGQCETLQDRLDSSPAAIGGGISAAVIVLILVTVAVIFIRRRNKKLPTGNHEYVDTSKDTKYTETVFHNTSYMKTAQNQNTSEWQLYRVLQKANLLQYYDSFISKGGDDVQQLCDAGEKEFSEIMALVGMASKPLHVRRLQKTLQEWMTNPDLVVSTNENLCFGEDITGTSHQYEILFSKSPHGTNNAERNTEHKNNEDMNVYDIISDSKK